MAKIISGKVVNQTESFVRDGLGLVATTGLSETLKEIGAIISYFVSPKIAKTKEGQAFNKMWAILMFFDKLLERFFGGKGIVE